MPAPPKIDVDRLVRLAAEGHAVEAMAAELGVHRTSVKRALAKVPSDRIVSERVALIKAQERARAERERRHRERVRRLREPKPEPEPQPTPKPGAPGVLDYGGNVRQALAYPLPVPDEQATDPSWRPSIGAAQVEEKPAPRRRRRRGFSTVGTALMSPLDMQDYLARGQAPYGLAAFVQTDPPDSWLDQRDSLLLARDPASSRVFRIDPSLAEEYRADGFVVS